MALEMKRGKDSVRFEWSDGEVESTVNLLPEDDQDTLVRKMRRVVALVEGAAPAAPPALVPYLPAMPGPYKDAASGAQALVGNGWAAFSPPPVPDHLKDQVELIDPSEPVEGS